MTEWGQRRRHPIVPQDLGETSSKQSAATSLSAQSVSVSHRTTCELNKAAQTSHNGVLILGHNVKYSLHLAQHLLNPLAGKQDGIVHHPELQWQQSLGI